MNKEAFNAEAKAQAKAMGKLVEASQTPVGDVVAKGKAWWDSKTVIAGIVTMVTLGLSLFGYDLGDLIPFTFDQASKAAGHADTGWVAIQGIIGAAVMVWARVKAVFKIK